MPTDSDTAQVKQRPKRNSTTLASLISTNMHKARDNNTLLTLKVFTALQCKYVEQCICHHNAACLHHCHTTVVPCYGT